MAVETLALAAPFINADPRTVTIDDADRTYHQWLTPEEISERIASIAIEVGNLALGEGNGLHVIGTLIGGMPTMTRFMAGLDRVGNAIDVTEDVVRFETRDMGTRASGVYRYSTQPQTPFETLGNKRIVLIDDIVDRGTTTRALVDDFRARMRGVGMMPALTVVTMLNKPSARVVGLDDVDVKSAFEIPDEFALGEGMDYRGRYRQWQGVWLPLPRPKSYPE